MLDVFSAHRAECRVLSIAASTEGIAHLRDLMNAVPADVAHLLKAGRKELLLHGVCVGHLAVIGKGTG